MVRARGCLGWLREGGVPLAAARLCVGGVYVWYGVNKVADPVAFLKALHGYDMLPHSPPHLLNLAVVVLPWLEVLCGALLLLGVWRRTAAGLLLAMTVFFTVVVTVRARALAAAGGLPLCSVQFDCGCGLGEVWFCTKVAENAALVLLAALALASRSRRWELTGRRPGPGS